MGEGTVIDSVAIEIEAASEEATKNIDRVTSALGRMRNAATRSGTTKIRVDSKEADTAARRVSKLTTLLNSIKRIAFYRAIRSGIRAVTDAVKVGINNLYEWSNAATATTRDGRRFADAMDSIATSAQYAKNGIGTLVGPLLASLAPAIETVTNAFVDFINVLNQVFAALRGDTSYTRAIRDMTKYSDATAGAAKATKDFLLGIDELNVINDSKGNGGGLDVDYSNMFEEAAIDNPLANLILKIKGVNVELDGIDQETIASKIIGAVIGGIIGYTLLGPVGMPLGMIVGASFSANIKEALFDGDGKITRPEILRMAKTLVIGTGMAIAGWKVAGGKGALLGFTLGALLSLSTDKALFNKGSATQSELEQSVRDTLTMIAGAVIGFTLWGYPGMLIGATAGVGISMLLNEALFKKGTAKVFDLNDSLIVALNAITGAIIGAKIGFKLGTTGLVAGALIGALVGVGVSLAIENAVFEKGNASSDVLKATLISALNIAIGALVGAGIGLAFGPTGGVVGAFIGATVGLGLTLEIIRADFTAEKSLGDMMLENMKNSLNGVMKEGISFISGNGNAVALGVQIGVSLLFKILGVSFNKNNEADIARQIEDGISDMAGGRGAATAFGVATGGHGSGGITFASGGYPDEGQMFIAREAGPELVGSIGNRTAVANNDQIVAGIASGVASANGEQNALLREQNQLLRAILQKSGVVIDGKTIKTAYDRATRESGAGIMAGGVLA